MEIKPAWKDHPLTKQGYVELISTDWLYNIRGQDVSPLADLKNGSLVDIDTLWENIVAEGLHDPVVIRVGTKNRKYRLESGNHRIQVLKKYGVLFTPATVQVQEDCGPQSPDIMTDANHNYELSEKISGSDLKIGYMKPSTIFHDLRNDIKKF